MTGMDKCRLVALQSFTDPRGVLTPIEGGTDIPFLPLRAFVLSNVPADQGRGFHAHRFSDEYLLVLQGSVMVALSDGRQERGFRLDRPDEGLFIPPMIWIELTEFTADAIVLALASRPYDPVEYITSKADFMKEAGR